MRADRFYWELQPWWLRLLRVPLLLAVALCFLLAPTALPALDKRGLRQES